MIKLFRLFLRLLRQRKEFCEYGTIYRAKDKLQHQRSAAHIFKTTGKLPEKCFDIEETSNYYRIQVYRQDVTIDIKKTFCTIPKRRLHLTRLKQSRPV
jgi:RecA-family ATPase